MFSGILRRPGTGSWDGHGRIIREAGAAPKKKAAPGGAAFEVLRASRQNLYVTQP